jgi:hypothetical protein
LGAAVTTTTKHNARLLTAVLIVTTIELPDDLEKN